MLRSKIIFAVALAFAAPVAAESPVLAGQGQYEGQAFQHSSRLLSGDVIRIDGNFTENGETFQLLVKPNGTVAGTVGRTPVFYRVSRAERDRLARAIAAVSEGRIASAAGGHLASAR
jgi:hypothetical protein